MMRRRWTTVVVSLTLALAASGCGSGSGDGAGGVASASTLTGVSASASASPTLAPAERSPIDGAYTMTLTRHDVLAAGLHASTASHVVGVWDVTFSFGYAQQFVHLGGVGGITQDGYQGGYSVAGDRLTLTDHPTLAFRWRLARKQLTLTLVDQAPVDPVDALIWTAHPWERTSR